MIPLLVAMPILGAGQGPANETAPPPGVHAAPLGTHTLARFGDLTFESGDTTQYTCALQIHLADKNAGTDGTVCLKTDGNATITGKLNMNEAALLFWENVVRTMPTEAKCPQAAAP